MFNDPTNYIPLSIRDLLKIKSFNHFIKTLNII
jgi:hypothetical protein